jgi:hypothetical protein
MTYSFRGLLVLEVTDERDRQARIDHTESQPRCARQRIPP